MWIDSSPVANIVDAPAGTPRPRLKFPFSSIKATVPIIKNVIPQTICNKGPLVLYVLAIKITFDKYVF